MTPEFDIASEDGAIFSHCRQYRYGLWRTWDAGIKKALFVGLNPSSADENRNDPTIRRLIGFSRSWGYGGIMAGNLFGWRTPFPKQLWGVNHPIGAQNDQWLKWMGRHAGIILACWGNGGAGVDKTAYARRISIVRHLLPAPLYCLGLTKQGQPRHPLYLKKETLLEKLY